MKVLMVGVVLYRWWNLWMFPPCQCGKADWFTW